MAFVSSCGSASAASAASAAAGLSSASHGVTTLGTGGSSACTTTAVVGVQSRTRTRTETREGVEELGGLGGRAVGDDGKEVAVVWFRGEDLRVHDHPALMTALEDGHVIAALVTPSVSQCRSSFYRACVNDLRHSFRELRGELFIRGPSAGVVGQDESLSEEEDEGMMERVVDFVVETGAKHLYAHQGIRRQAVREERMIQQILRRRLDVQTRLLWTGTLRAPDELPFAIDSAPEECDEFSCRVAMLPIQPPLPAPQSQQNPPFVTHLPTGALPVGDATSDNNAFAAGESAGLRRVHDYVVGRSLASVSCPSASQKETKDDKAIDTKLGRLSPFLAAGCVSPRRLWHEIVGRTPSPSLRRFCAELDLTLRDFTRVMTLKYGVVPA